MIAFDNVSKGFRGKTGEINWVLKNISFSVEKGINFGILAPRGEGKTVLIDMVCGSQRITKGHIVRTGYVSPPYGSRAHITSRFSLAQNLRFMCDVYGRDFEEAMEFIDDFAEIGRSIEKPFSKCSNDVKGRFCAGALLAMDFDHMVIDDAVEGGDPDFRKKCLEYLGEKRERTSSFVASSNPAVISALCDSAGVLHESRLTIYDEIDDALRHFEEINKVLV